VDDFQAFDFGAWYELIIRTVPLDEIFEVFRFADDENAGRAIQSGMPIDTHWQSPLLTISLWSKR
jgi:hypothetical protein